MQGAMIVMLSKSSGPEESTISQVWSNINKTYLADFQRMECCLCTFQMVHVQHSQVHPWLLPEHS